MYIMSHQKAKPLLRETWAVWKGPGGPEDERQLARDEAVEQQNQ